MRYPTARETLVDGLAIPAGVRLLELTDHEDERGAFRELFRDAWTAGPRPVQWNMVWSRPNVLRGVHVHRDHVDHLSVATGELILGLYDFRQASPTAGLSAMLRLRGDDPHLAEIPPGVGHAFYFPVATMHVYGVSTPFTGYDGLECRWDDPDLGFVWPTDSPILSERDRAARSCREVAQALDAQDAA